MMRMGRTGFLTLPTALERAAHSRHSRNPRLRFWLRPSRAVSLWLRNWFLILFMEVWFLQAVDILRAV